MMYPTILGRAEALREYLGERSAQNEALEMKDILGRFTTDVIGTCAFGIECNTLKNPDSEFRKKGVKILVPTFYESIKGLFLTIFRDTSRKLRLCNTPQDVTNFFMTVVKDTVEYRENNNITRPDFMQLLIQLKNKGVLDDEVVDDETSPNEMKPLTMNEVTAQAFIFFLAGFETSSSTMSFCLYELATNQAVQDKVREEIDIVLKKYDGKMTYEALLEMEYLDRAINETMRKYPTLPILNRECTKDYSFPGSDVVISKGTQVLIPVRGLHHDPEYYPDPDTFDPERFTEENKASRPACTFLPFGEGPRICIGIRFGMMQTRLGLIVMLKNYKFTVGKQTSIPLVIDPKAFLTSCLGGIWLNLKPIM